VVVVVGATVIEPLAAVELNAPGVMVMLVAPEVLQLIVELLEPEFIKWGLAEKDLIEGLDAAKQVTEAISAKNRAHKPASGKRARLPDAIGTNEEFIMIPQRCIPA